MATIFLCRHGETESSRNDQYYYRENSPPTQTGHLQTTALAEFLSKEPVSAVFSSPLDRALCTADSIALHHQLPVDILPLAEWNPGHWSGLRRSEVRTKFPSEYERWSLDPATYPPLQAESCYDVAARVVPAFNAIAESYTEDTIAVIGHRTVNRIILAHAMGIPIARYRRTILQDAGALNKLYYIGAGNWEIGLLNCPALSLLRRGVATDDRSTTEPSTQIDFLGAIDQVHERLTVIWPDGRNACIQHDGRHWMLPSFDRPVSVGRVEAFFLYNLAASFAPRIMLEIGTGFGYSSLWLAAGGRASNAASTLFTIDDHSEGGLGQEGVRFTRLASKITGLQQRIRLVHGRSPEILPSLLGDHRVGLSFLDGNHHGEQPYNDFKGLSEFMEPDGIIIWHDVDPRYAVPQAFQRAAEQGWQGKVYNTSCRIGVSYRQSNLEASIDRAYEAACNLQVIKT